MIKLTPAQMMWIGGILLVVGVIFPLLMVVHIIQTTFVLGFISYIFSTIGMFMGMIGAFSYVKEKRR